MSGGDKSKQTMIAKYGSEEAYRQHMREIRKRVKKHPGGSFKGNPELAREMSKKALERRWGNGKTDN
jgi:general stress protein YciG